MCQIDYLFRGGNKNRKRRFENEIGIHILDDLNPSEPPLKSSWIDKCPSSSSSLSPLKNNKLCLNMIRNEFPLIKLTVNIPFKDNAIVIEEIEKIKIARISVDATFEEDVYVMLNLINLGFVESKYRVVMGMCLSPDYLKKSFHVKNLSPNVESKTCFKFPINSIFESNQENTTCEGKCWFE